MFVLKMQFNFKENSIKKCQRISKSRFNSLELLKFYAGVQPQLFVEPPLFAQDCCCGDGYLLDNLELALVGICSFLLDFLELWILFDFLHLFLNLLQFCLRLLYSG